MQSLRIKPKPCGAFTILIMCHYRSRLAELRTQRGAHRRGQTLQGRYSAMPPTPKLSPKKQAAVAGVAKKKPSSHKTTKKQSPTAPKKRPASGATTKKPAVHTQHKLTAASCAQQGQEGSHDTQQGREGSEYVALPLTPQQRQAWGPDHRQYTRHCSMKIPRSGEWQLVSWTENWVRTRRPT